MREAFDEILTGIHAVLLCEPFHPAHCTTARAQLTPEREPTLFTPSQATAVEFARRRRSIFACPITRR
jgi:hypothetical protein